MKKFIQKYLTRILFFLGVILLSPQVFALTHEILVNNGSFSPSTLSITDGDGIYFKLAPTGNNNHPVVADNGSGDWTTFTLANPGDVSGTFILAVGTHGYHCQVHGSVGGGMFGTITVNTVAGTKGKTSAYGLNVAPNPFVDEVTLNIDPSHSELTAIKITDLIGNDVAFIDLSSKTASAYNLDLSHLRPGVYFCNLYSDKGILETRKLFRTK